MPSSTTALHSRSIAGHGEAHAFVAERLEAAGAWTELATLLRDRLEKNPSASTQTRTLLRLRLARVLAEGAGEPAEAAVVLEAARGEAGTLVPIAEPLADLYARLGRREDESRALRGRRGSVHRRS